MHLRQDFGQFFYGSVIGVASMGLQIPSSDWYPSLHILQ